MPRKPRFFLPDIPVHVVQRGHSRESVFFEGMDYQMYLGWLEEAAERYQCAVHAYVLMSNHVHLLVTPEESHSISRLMQYVGRRYVPYINEQYETSGSIWEGLFKASLIQDETYLLACMRYIELNPVRTSVVKHPRHYRWSSYRANGEGKDNSLINPHSLYRSLGKTKKKRQNAYRDLFKVQIDEDENKSIHAAWQTGTPLGNDKFKEKIEKKLKVKVGHNRRGRPSLKTVT